MFIQERESTQEAKAKSLCIWITCKVQAEQRTAILGSWKILHWILL